MGYKIHTTLRDRGVPCTALETDRSQSGCGRLSARLEVFIERQSP